MTEDNGRITYSDDGKLNVPDFPVIPFIEGDGTGPDIWRAARRGWKFWPVRKRLIRHKPGFQKKPWKRSGFIALP